MTVNRFAAFVLALLFILGAPVVSAQAAGDASPLRFSDVAEEQRFHDLVVELRCVMCQNQSLADSNAQIAVDLRREVLTLMQDGKSDTEIKEYLVARYGEFVLYRPEVKSHTWLLWFGPLIVLVLGAVTVALTVRRRSRSAPASSDDSQEW